MRKTILHIDFDSFFASAEQQDNPNLRNKPLGVTAANGRTCIIASSREAKKLENILLFQLACPTIDYWPSWHRELISQMECLKLRKII